MEVTTIITADIKITLNATEAWWLVGFLQNAHSEDEPATETEMRGMIFDGLKDALKNIPRPTPPPSCPRHHSDPDIGSGWH